MQPPVAQGVCAVGAAPNYDVTFTPVAGFEGVSSCTYQICDLNTPNAQCDTATISVTVAAGVAPVANNDTSSGLFGAAQTVDPLPNDTDANGDIDNTSVTITANANAATEGTCTAASPNVTFTPVANFAGNTTCTYQVCDDTARCDTADIVFTVAPGATPVATDDTGSGNFGDPITVDVQGNDTDADGNLDPSSTTLTAQPPVAEGACTLTGAPNYDVTFTPAANFTGNSTCTYQVCDSNTPTPQCDTADVVFTVGTGAAPIAGNDVGAGTFGQTVTVDVQSNDTDPDGNLDPSSTSIDTQPPVAEGVCSVGAAPGYDVSFVPASGFNGSSSCVYEICDANIPTPQCDTATLSVTIGSGNAPLAGDDIGSGNFGDPITVDVQANDTDPDSNLDPSSTSIDTQPPVAEGVCAVGGAPNYDVTFTPALNFAGNSTCTYEICDSNSPTPQCDTADIVFTVGAGAAPVANDDTATTDPNVAVVTNVATNDTDADGNLDTTSVTLTGGQPNAATEGSCSVASPNITFTPVAAYLGGDVVCNYQICDSNTPTAQCDTASLTITVDGDPVAVADTGSGNFGDPITVDVQVNDTEPNGDLDPSTTTIDTQAPVAEGVCAVGGAPNYDVTFTPAANFAGNSTCTYQVCDGSTPANCDTADVVFTVAPGGAPVATDDTGSGSFGDPITVDVQANDTDPDGNLDPSSTSIDTQPPVAEGVCAVGTAPNYDVTFTPAANFAGNSTCTYEICDLNSPTPQCDTADVVFTVGAGAAPVANDDTAQTNPGVAVVADVIGGSTTGAVADTDADSNLNQSSLSITTNANAATEGTCAVTNAPLSDITFTPVPAFTGAATCTYQVCDSNTPTAQCDTAVLTINVNNPPVANDDAASDPDFGDPVVIAEATITTNDTAGSGTLDASTITIDTNANPTTEGTCAVSGTSPYDITFTPIANFVDTATCTYEICNSNGLCDTADITFDPADGAAPVANDDTANTSIDTAVTIDVTAGAGADTDADGNLDNTSVTITTNANPTTEGTCTVASPNVTFTPVSGYTGTATCSYQVCDSNLNTPQCDTATLTVTVNPACGASATPVEFSFTGSDQSYTPTDATVTHIRVKVWGAGGGSNGGPASPCSQGLSHGFGGSGGFTSGILSVNPSDLFSIVVGEGGGFEQTSVFGFGGSAGSSSREPSGGGLSGFFTGSAAVLQTDASRAILIAGGGGGGSASCQSGIQSGTNGGNGNDLMNSGGQSDFEGINGPSELLAAGGGGYFGGDRHTRGGIGPGTANAGEGGRAFVIGGLVSSEVLYTPEFLQTPPNTNDSDYNTGIGVGAPQHSVQAGHGLVVITEMCANNDNPPFAAIDRESTAPDTNATFDVGANDADIDGDLDLSSITIDTNAPVAEGTCSVGSNPGEIDFAPASGFTGTTSCVYEICDSSGTRCDTATLEIAVEPPTCMALVDPATGLQESFPLSYPLYMGASCEAINNDSELEAYAGSFSSTVATVENNGGLAELCLSGLSSETTQALDADGDGEIPVSSQFMNLLQHDVNSSSYVLGATSEFAEWEIGGVNFFAPQNQVAHDYSIFKFENGVASLAYNISLPSLPSPVWSGATPSNSSTYAHIGGKDYLFVYRSAREVPTIEHHLTLEVYEVTATGYTAVTSLVNFRRTSIGGISYGNYGGKHYLFLTSAMTTSFPTSSVLIVEFTLPGALSITDEVALTSRVSVNGFANHWEVSGQPYLYVPIWGDAANDHNTNSLVYTLDSGLGTITQVQTVGTEGPTGSKLFTYNGTQYLSIAQERTGSGVATDNRLFEVNPSTGLLSEVTVFGPVDASVSMDAFSLNGNFFFAEAGGNTANSTVFCANTPSSPIAIQTEAKGTGVFGTAGYLQFSDSTGDYLVLISQYSSGVNSLKVFKITK